jgi:hypothetical protein
MLGAILTIILILLVIGLIPRWGYSSGWGYYPSGGLGLILLMHPGTDWWCLERIVVPFQKISRITNPQCLFPASTAPSTPADSNPSHLPAS